MDEDRKLTHSHGKAPACLPWSKDDPTLLWHSTPIKKRSDGAAPDYVGASDPTDSRMDPRWTAPNPSARAGLNPSSTDPGAPVKDLSSSTNQRLRKELQLLVVELKDREAELNAMTTAHRRQRRCWEEDRQRGERRRGRLEDELLKCYEMIRALSGRLSAAERREADVQKKLRDARRKIKELEEEPRVNTEQWLRLQEENRSLGSTVAVLSNQLGALQVREAELSSTLKLKDEDVSEASSQIRQLSGRLQQLETSERRRRDATQEVAHLTEELQQQVTQSSSQREEIIRLKQEVQLLHRDLAITEGGDSWKDELLQAARSKQERLTSELHCLRQVCENQHNDLQQLREKTSVQERRRSLEQLLCDCVNHRNPRASRSDPPSPPEALRGSAHLRGDATLSDDDGALEESRLLAGSDVRSLRRSVTSDPCVLHTDDV